MRLAWVGKSKMSKAVTEYDIVPFRLEGLTKWLIGTIVSLNIKLKNDTAVMRFHDGFILLFILIFEFWKAASYLKFKKKRTYQETLKYTHQHKNFLENTIILAEMFWIWQQKKKNIKVWSQHRAIYCVVPNLHIPLATWLVGTGNSYRSVRCSMVVSGSYLTANSYLFQTSIMLFPTKNDVK